MPTKGKNRKFKRFRKQRFGDRKMPIQVTSTSGVPRPLTVSQNRIVRMQFRNYFQLVCNGSGICAAYLPFDPSVTLSAALGGQALFPEWTSVVNLYNVIKFVQAEIYLTRTYVDDNKGDSSGPVAISSVAQGNYVTPSSYGQVLDNGDSQLWNCLQDYSGRPFYHSVRIKGLAWASTGTPNPGSSGGALIGCPGWILIYAANNPASATIAYVKVVMTYQLRFRS